MSRPSRSKSKTNPAFDFSELADLIHTPAVGSGVSSHLLERPEGYLTTVVTTHTTTEDKLHMSTVVKSDQLWVSEDGAYVPPKKVRRIHSALDALSSAEQTVYELLARFQPEGGEAVQAGYDLIMKRTGLSKKTVQRIIDKLIDKDFIAIEIPADIYRRTSTVYRVFPCDTVLARHASKNRLYIAKIGPGKVYVRQFTPETYTQASSQH